MTIFKKSVSTLAIASLLFSALAFQPKKADAAIIIGISINAGDGSGGDDALISGAAGALIGTIVGTVVGAVAGLVSGNPTLGLETGACVLVLDVDGSLRRDSLERMFDTKYPFLDSEEAISNLVTVVQSKMPAKFDAEKNYKVSLSEEETRKALSSVDLSDEQIAQIAKDLK